MPDEGKKERPSRLVIVVPLAGVLISIASSWAITDYSTRKTLSETLSAGYTFTAYISVRFFSLMEATSSTEVRLIDGQWLEVKDGMHPVYKESIADLKRDLAALIKNPALAQNKGSISRVADMHNIIMQEIHGKSRGFSMRLVDRMCDFHGMTQEMVLARDYRSIRSHIQRGLRRDEKRQVRALEREHWEYLDEASISYAIEACRAYRAAAEEEKMKDTVERLTHGVEGISQTITRMREAINALLDSSIKPHRRAP